MKDTQTAKHIAKRCADLYAYLTTRSGERCSKREIYEAVPGYEWNETCWDKCPVIRNDMKLINADPAYEKLIVFDKQEYYVATKEEVEEYYQKKLRSLIRLKTEMGQLWSKMSKDGQGFLEGGYGDPYIGQ